MASEPAAPFDVATVLAAMTLAEKVRLCAGRDYWTLYGVPRLGVPTIRLSDGPYGLRKQLGDLADPTQTATAPATCFPTSSALAATWDEELIEQVGTALGREARAEGVSVLLGPGGNLKRSPLCGRNFEYFAEDPLLSGRIAAAWIRGVQGTGVAASLKHFAVNNQEHRRYTVDALVDERTLRELYLAAFEHAVRGAGPWTVMTAYNRVNGVFCSENASLLAAVLRREWGFDGVVVSDWGATNDRVTGLLAGLDVEMPGYAGHSEPELLGAVESGRLPVAALDEAVRRILTLIARTAPARLPGHAYDRGAHHELARRVAAEGIVLLKNDDGILPLRTDAHVAVLGAFASRPRYQGAGSATVTPHRVEDAYREITALVSGSGRVSFAPGYFRDSDRVDRAVLAEAVEAARAADVALVFVGLTEAYETEGLDRADLRLPAAHDALVYAVAQANPRVVVVLSNGAPVQMPWHGRVPAIVEGYLGGQAGGGAVARVLFGLAEPGGRLAETFPHRWIDNPVHALPTGPRQVEYRESLYVGYRYYGSADRPVLFPFGHGLGYTTFGYADLTVAPEQVAADAPVRVEVTVTNTGTRAGAEVVQVYLHAVDPPVFRPAQELAGFVKVRLAPGESRRVTVEIASRGFAHYDVGRGAWVVAGGRFEVRVGASSADIRLTATVEVTGAAAARRPDRGAPAVYREPAGVREFDRDSFARLYRRPLPENTPERYGSYTLNTPLSDMRDSVPARLLLGTARLAARRMTADRTNPMAQLVGSVLSDMSVRTLLLVSRGALRTPLLPAVLDLVNGRYARAAAALVRGIRTDRRNRRGR